MDELYIESFSKKELNQPPKDKSSSILEDHPMRDVEVNHQILFYLEKLEREITLEYTDFTNFRFIFDKIKKRLKTNNVDGIEVLLEDLEELLDIDLPAILLKKALEKAN